jgi:HlyD family secretion protein
MHLAPVDSTVEAEVRIAPRDIGFIRPGDPVKVKFEAFDFVEHGTAAGTISWISVGSFVVDEKTKQPTAVSYYKARIHLNDAQLRNVPEGFRIREAQRRGATKALLWPWSRMTAFRRVLRTS